MRPTAMAIPADCWWPFDIWIIGWDVEGCGDTCIFPQNVAQFKRIVLVAVGQNCALIFSGVIVQLWLHILIHPRTSIFQWFFMSLCIYPRAHTEERERSQRVPEGERSQIILMHRGYLTLIKVLFECGPIFKNHRISALS